MSTLLDETAADVPVRDVTVNLSRLSAFPQDMNQNARTRQDIGRVSREELEDRFLRLYEETLLLKQHIHNQDDKIKKLGTKLMRLVKDRGRMEQLAAGGPQPLSKLRDVEMEEMMEELQDKVRGLQAENERLKQRLLVAKQQLVTSQSQRPVAYGHVQPRVNSGMKRLREDTSSPSQIRPKSTRSLEGGGRPPSGHLPRYGHSLLEEARAEIRNLENVIESQRSHMEELEGASEQLREEMRRKEVDYEERLVQARQQQTSNLRSHVNSNVVMIKLQKQLVDRSNAVAELEGRFLQLQETQLTLRTSHEAAMAKVDELSAQLKDERLKSLDLERQLQTSNISKRRMEQLDERIRELEQERDQLKDANERLVNRALDVSQQQKHQILEHQLRVQISQLEAALKADLVDKNEILDKIQAERDTNDKLSEENKKLHVQFLEQKQQLEETRERLKFYSREGDYDVSELTEALLLIKTRRSQQRGDLGFLKEVEEEVKEEASSRQTSITDLRAAHAETIQELEKTRNLLNMESRISKDYKVELEAALRKMEADKVEYEQKLQRQTELMETRAAKIRKLEAQLRDIAYGTKTYAFKADVPAGDESEDEPVHLERGENLVEFQIVGVTLSPDALQALGDTEPSTFCTYSFYLFEPHSTPVVTGREPKYGFTSRYVVSMDDGFLRYLHGGSVAVELHQALGLDWRTLARGHVRLQQLLEQDGKLRGSIPLVGAGEEAWSFGSLEFWLRLKLPKAQTALLFKEKLKALDYLHTAAQTQPSSSRSWNELSVSVLRCSGLRSRCSQRPSSYVVYKFFNFPDYPTATADDRTDPDFHDVKSYSVLMDQDLDRYLKSEELWFYVFDYKEEQLDWFLGKAGVPLRDLVSEHSISGEFELVDPCGRPSGHIDVTLKWTFSYVPPSDSEEFRLIPEETAKQKPEQLRVDLEEERKHVEEEQEEEEEQAKDLQRSSRHPEDAQAPPPKPAQRKPVKDGASAKKVTFVDSAADEQPEDESPVKRKDRSAVKVVSKAPRSATEEGEDDEESHVSDGQLVSASAQSSDGSEVSEEIPEDVVEAPDCRPDGRESSQSDSDDCIIHGLTTGRKPTERVRVEIVSLSLRPGSRVTRDDSVVRLFVEYSFLDLPTEETPLSLPKPPQGKSLNYNYSKVVPVDAENNEPRRRLLRRVLQGRNPQMERIRFTVVSEPPEEEEQDRECEDVGVAFLRIPEILETGRDLMESSLTVVDVEDSSEVVGSLVVSVEGLEALQSIMEDQDQDQETTAVAPLLTSRGLN
ncbi:protein fantom [Mugil cephalus]|uniref:protein fantom n=1 Tax=Mugil cephalus TaxID=48193 RepID=UPI001FB704E5|nr:protein fantom [Mugil cephalus]